MIRSQSITLADKRKTGLLNSLRNRKSSSKDLNGFLKTRTLNETNTDVNKRHSVMLMSPKEKDYQHHTKENKENKENRASYRLSYKEEIKSIKKDENQPEIVRDSISGKEKSVSRRALRIFRLRVTPPSSEKTIATAGLEPSDVVSMETLSLDPLSPNTPINIKLETSELSPLTFQEFASYLQNFDDEPSTPSKLHRTVNIANIQDLINSMDEKILPLGNRKSLDVEANEFKQLQTQLSKQPHDLNLYLVENAMFMSFFQRSSDEAIQRLTRYWDEIDVTETFKMEKYHLDDNIYMHM